MSSELDSAANAEFPSAEPGDGGGDGPPGLIRATSTSPLAVRVQQLPPAATDTDEDTTWLWYLLASCMVLAVFSLGVALYALTRTERRALELWKPLPAPPAQPTTKEGPMPHVPTFEPPPNEDVAVTEQVVPLEENKRVPVMCTVSNAFGADGIIPPDGTCDALFYDSLYRDGRNKLPGPYDGGLERFLDLGRRMRYTGFGVSFDVLMDVRKFDVTSPNFTSGIVELWNRGVNHFGALRVFGAGNAEDDVLTFLYFLQAVEEKIEGIMTVSRPYYTVIGVSLHRDASYEKVIRHMKIVFKPFIYVVVIHVPYLDKELPTCLILPPTLLENTVEATSSNQSSVMEAMRHIERVHSHNVYLPMAISFTLRARFYKPASLHNASFYEPFQKCQNYSGDSDVSPASVCKGRYGSNFNYFSDGESVFVFDMQQERTVTYDTDLTIRTKACSAKMAYPDVPFGLAAFDIDLDIANTACYELQIEAGNFNRLKALSRLNDYISGYSSSLDQCMNFT